MADAAQAPAGRVAPLVCGGAVLVALTTPFNLILLLLCWRFIAATAGSYAADNSAGGLVFLAVVVNVGLFLALCGLAGRILRRSSLFRRRVAVAVVLVLHLGLWLGLSLVAIAQMVATDNWL